MNLETIKLQRRRYAVQHIVSHLAAAREWSRLWELMDANSYTRAKLNYDPSMASYAQDLDTARQAAIDATEGNLATGIELLPNLWRYSLLRCTINEQVEAYPDEVIEFFAIRGNVQLAYGMAEVLPDEERKATVLSRIGQHLMSQTENCVVSQTVLMRGLELAQSIQSSEGHDSALANVISSMLKAGLFDQAITAVHYLKNSNGYVHEWCLSLLEAGRLDAVLKIVVIMSRKSGVQELISRVVLSLSDADEPDIARAIALRLEHSLGRDMLKPVVHAFFRAQRLDDTLITQRAIDELNIYTMLQQQIFTTHPVIPETDVIIAAWYDALTNHQLAIVDYRDLEFATVSKSDLRKLVLTGQLNTALQLVHKLDDVSHRSEAIGIVLRVLTEMKCYKQAEDL